MDKLSSIQKVLRVPKNQLNKFGNYKYRSCEDILEGVKPHLDGARIHLSDELVMIGSRYYIKATAMFIDGDVCISTTAYAREEESKKGMDSAQITGTASSYARKYALNGLLLIDDQKDADTDEHQKETTTKPKQQQGQNEPTPKRKMFLALQAKGLTEAEITDLASFVRMCNAGELTGETMLEVASRADAYVNEWRTAKAEDTNEDPFE